VSGVQKQWTGRAELAVKSGQDDLAREALKKRKAFQEQIGTWQVRAPIALAAARRASGNLCFRFSQYAKGSEPQLNLPACLPACRACLPVCLVPASALLRLRWSVPAVCA
jgi:hypothetical protein